VENYVLFLILFFKKNLDGEIFCEFFIILIAPFYISA
jgi:hypothetical protein